MLVSTKDMLLDARAKGYAIGAFNVENMEMIQAVIWAAEKTRAPVILQTTSGTLTYAPPAAFAGAAMALAKDASVPVALHLDHGQDLELCHAAFRAGYTSVMIDGSKEPLDRNITVTRAVTALCHPHGVPVEGELGRVGGKEDDTEDAESGYTDPAEAERFVRETAVDSLAVGVGTAHGLYTAAPVLNVPLIGVLHGLPVPLVLHGASGLSDEAIQACIAQGIAKVNFATELRAAYTQAVRAYLDMHPDAIDPKAYGKAARAAVQTLVETRMQVCGCAGKA